MSHPTAVCLGEILIDFMAQPRVDDLVDAESFLPKPGGAPANVAVGLQRLGVPSAFIGMVGDDAFGRLLRNTLDSEGVKTRGLKLTGDQPTTLAFVALSETGVPSFSFVRHPGADQSLRPEDVDTNLVREARVFHFGSLSLCQSPAYDATLYALDVARDSGCYVTYDPNFRPALWKDEAMARQRMLEPMGCVDLVKVSSDELLLLTEIEDMREAVGRIHALGPGVVLVTLGAGGMAASNGSDWIEIPAEPVEAMDTTGCGDASMAGIIAALLRSTPNLSGRERIDLPTLREAVRFANRCGALAAKKVGAIPSLPFARDLQD